MANKLKLTNYIREHGIVARLTPDGCIQARDVYTYRDEHGDIKPAYRWVEIDPDIKVVKRWLGY